jgi:hypothetical protein
MERPATPSRRTAVSIGLLGGAWTLAALMFPTSNPMIPSLAVLGPIGAGAIVAARTARRDQRELDVDEAAYLGLVTGLATGFVAAVPFPLAMSFFGPGQAAQSAPSWLSTAGLVARIGVAGAMLLITVAVTMLSSVIASRFVRGRTR